MAGSHLGVRGLLGKVVDVAFAAGVGVPGSLRQGGHAEDDVVAELRLSTQGVLVSLLCQVLVDKGVLLRRGPAPRHIHLGIDDGQLLKGRNGRRHLLGADVGGVLRHIHSHLGDPVVPLVGVGAGHVDDILAHGLRGRIGVLRHDAPAPQGHAVEVVHTGALVIQGHEVVLDELLLGNGDEVRHVLGAADFHQRLGEAHLVILLLGVGQGQAAALGDALLEEALGLLHHTEEGGGAAAGGLAEDGHVVGVAAEGLNVLLDPLQGLDMVQQTQAGGVLVVLAALHLGEVDEAHEADAVVGGDHDDVLVLLHEELAVIEGIGGAAPGEAATVEEDHHRLAGGTEVLGPDVQGQAVLADLVVGRPLAGPLILDAALAELVRGEGLVAVVGGLGGLPAELAHRGLGVGDALEGQHAGVLQLAHEVAVAAVRRQVDALCRAAAGGGAAGGVCGGPAGTAQQRQGQDQCGDKLLSHKRPSLSFLLFRNAAGRGASACSPARFRVEL